MWGLAIYFSGKRDYSRGLSFLINSEKYRVKADAEMLLLKGFLLASTDKESDAEFFLELAERKIKDSKKLNRDEKIYLNNYRLILLSKIKKGLVFFDLDDSYDNSKVSKHLKDNHPC
jgi:hypothetical protein